MQLKLKQRITLVFTVAVLMLFALQPGFVNAQSKNSIDPAAITVTTELRVGGKADNIIRVVRDSSGKIQPVKFTVLVTLNSPAQGLELDRNDYLDFKRPGWIEFFKDYTAPRSGQIIYFGVGIDSALSGNTCRTVSLPAGIGGLTSTNDFYLCTFKEKQNVNAGNKVESGRQYTVEFELNNSNLNSLELVSASASGTPKFRVYPHIGFFAGVATAFGSNITVNNAGKEMYVQFFPNQAALDQAVQNNSRPTDVPAYGANSGNAGFTNADGGVVTKFIKQVLGIIFGFITELIFILFNFLIVPLLESLLSIRTYTDVFSSIIYPGWEIVRNVCNIFFIVALVAIALATLFRVESYQFRSLLVKLVIAALLVNFSLAISQVILGVADTIQNQFLPNNREVIRNLASNIMISPYASGVLGTQNASLQQQVPGATFADIIQQFVFLGMSLLSFVVFAAITAFLFIRICALWILLMLSPIPYVANILPTTTGYKDQWWSNFLKYAFFTPIMAFFLNVASIISSATLNNPVLQTVGAGDLRSQLGGDDIATFVFRFGTNIFLVMFLFAALWIAQQAGIMGASTAMGWAKKGFFAPFKVAGALGAAGLVAGRDGIKDAANKTRLRMAESLGRNDRNIVSKGLGAILAAPERSAARKEERGSDAKLLQKQLGERYTNRYRASAGKTSDTAELGTFDSVRSDAMKNISANSGVAFASNIKDLKSSKNISMNKKGEIAANIFKAAETENMEDMLEKMGYATDESGYVKLLQDLEKDYGFSRAEVEHLADQLDPVWRKTNRFNYANIMDKTEESQSLVEDVPDFVTTTVGGVTTKSAMREGEADYLKISHLATEDDKTRAIEALSEEERKKYYKYERYEKALKKQKGTLVKKGYKTLVSDYKLVAKDKDNKKMLKENVADLLTEGGPEMYKQADNVSEANKADMMELLEKDPKQVLEAFTKSIHKKQLADGINDPMGAQKKAREQVIEVARGLFGIEMSYNPGTGFTKPVRMPKTSMKLEDELRSDPATRPNLTGIVDNSIRSSVLQHYDEGYKNPGSFKYALPKSVTDAAARHSPSLTAEVSAVQDDVLNKMKSMLADRFKPQSISKNLQVNSGQLKDIKDEIQNSIHTIVTNPANATKSMGELRADIEREMTSRLSGKMVKDKATGTDRPLDASEIKLANDLILAGIA